MQQRIREAEAGGTTLDIRRTWVPLDRISPNLRRAVLVAEDSRFPVHRGIDWISIGEEVRWAGGDTFSWRNPDDRRALDAALRYAWAHRDEVRGRSTITQQLAKNLYFGTDRTFTRKVRELVVARRLERTLGKDRILELYLNLAEWGPGLFGAEAAAQLYFGRAAADLTLTQAAALAGTLPHPLTSNPARNSGQMRWRQTLILERLRPGAPATPMPIPEPVLPSEMPVPSLDEPTPSFDAPVPAEDEPPPDSVVPPAPPPQGVHSATAT